MGDSLVLFATASRWESRSVSSKTESVSFCHSFCTPTGLEQWTISRLFLGHMNTLIPWFSKAFSIPCIPEDILWQWGPAVWVHLHHQLVYQTGPQGLALSDVCRAKRSESLEVEQLQSRQLGKVLRGLPLAFAKRSLEEPRNCGLNHAKPEMLAGSNVGQGVVGKHNPLLLEQWLGRVTEITRCYCQPSLNSYSESWSSVK